MPQIAKLIGGAGTGKTRALIELLIAAVKKLGSPKSVGAISFTIAGSHEFACRAADEFNISPHELEKEGWYRTLHSVCYQCLGLKKGDVLTDDKEGREWFENTFGVAATKRYPAISEDENCPYTEKEKSSQKHTKADTIGRALLIHDRARHRMVAWGEAWGFANITDPDTPLAGYCGEIITRYEEAKAADGLLDFTDIVQRFANGDGEIPPLPCWIHDEMQDSSPLLDKAFRRLTSHDACQWVYLAGDPFQSIYGFGGADPKVFLDAPADKTRVMPKSWRCPAPILELGEDILRDCSDYFDREIKPADHKGEVDGRRLMCNSMIDEIDPTETWLLLARTNLLAKRWAAKLNAAGVPWVPTRGNGGWSAPKRQAICRAFWRLQLSQSIDGEDWKRCLTVVPVRDASAIYLEPGTKTAWGKVKGAIVKKEYPELSLNEIWSVGATQNLINAIQDSRWHDWLPRGAEFAEAMARWGESTVMNPKIKVGTIHSVKGEEADNVALISTVPQQVQRASRFAAGADEEARVWYVGCTRARKRLIIVREPRAKFVKRLPV